MISKPCPFCSLSSDRVVDQNDQGLVIRDGFPIAQGHTLLIPKRHIGSFFELTELKRSDLLLVLTTVKSVLESEYNYQISSYKFPIQLANNY